MKNYLLLLLCFGYLSVFSQNQITLTVREVVDLDIGDEFHYVHKDQLPGTSPIYQTIIKTVISKSQNIDSTILSYTFQVTKALSSSSGLSNCISVSTEQITYTNLDSSCLSLFPTIALTYTQQAPDPNLNNRIIVKGTDATGVCVQLVGAGLGDLGFVTPSYNVPGVFTGYKKGTEIGGVLNQQMAIPTFTNRLTVGEVYNFDIGDVFQYTYDQPSPFLSHKLIQDKIIGKQMGNDSVFYTVERNTDGIITIVYPIYHNLSDFVIPNSYLCEITEGQDSCSTIYNSSFSYDSPDFIHYKENKSVYYKGLGEYYDYKPYVGPEILKSLVYYHKVNQNLSCGNYIFLGVPEESYAKMEINYDFKENKVSIMTPSYEGDIDFEMMDMSGRTVKHEVYAQSEEKIDINTTEYPKGVYVIKVTTDKHHYFDKVLLSF